MSEAGVTATIPAVVAPAAPAVVVQETKPAADGTSTSTAAPGDPAKATTVSQGAPEKYAEYKAEEGVAVDPKALSAWADAAKKANLTQEQYDAAIKFQTGFIKEQIAAYDAHLVEQQKSIPSLMAKDPVMGGKDSVANVASAQRAWAAFDTDGSLRAVLDRKETPPDAYIALARFAMRVGKAIREDSAAGTTGAPAAVEKRAADVMFGTPPQKAS